MNEVRLTWHPAVVHHTDVVRFSRQWVPATLESIKTLNILVVAANEIYGLESHWIETREGPTPGVPPAPRTPAKSTP